MRVDSIISFFPDEMKRFDLWFYSLALMFKNVCCHPLPLPSSILQQQKQQWVVNRYWSITTTTTSTFIFITSLNSTLIFFCVFKSYNFIWIVRWKALYFVFFWEIYCWLYGLLVWWNYFDILATSDAGKTFNDAEGKNQF